MRKGGLDTDLAVEMMGPTLAKADRASPRWDYSKPLLAQSCHMGRKDSLATNG